MSAATDYIYKSAPLWTGAVGAAGVSDASTTTIPLAAATGLTNGAVYTVTIDRVDGSGSSTPTKREVVTGLLSGTDLTNCIRGEEGTAQAHSASAVVEILFTSTQWNKLYTGLVVEHSADGTHKSAVVTTLKASSAEITTGTSDVKLVTPKGIKDAGIVALTKAAGSDIVTGTDDAKFVTSKAIKDSGISTTKVVGIQVFDAATNIAIGDGKAYFRVPVTLNGMNLVGVAATVYTAGTTNTTDVQIRNKTDSVDMLSTKLTVDSGETDSSTATAAAIDATKDDVATGDVLAIDVDAVSTTPAKGLYVELRFALP